MHLSGHILHENCLRFMYTYLSMFSIEIHFEMH